MNPGKADPKPTLVAIGALALGIVALPAGAASLVIDDFSVSQGPLVVSPGGVVAPTSDASSASGGGVIGGSRDIVISADLDSNSPFTSSVTVAGGVMDYSNSTAFSSTLLFQWDGADNDPNTLDAFGLGGMNLNSGGNNAFEIGFLFDDLPATLDMTIYSMDGEVSSLQFPTTGLIFTSLSLFIPYDLFIGNADFGNLGAIELAITSPTNGADIGIDFIQTNIAPIPVPATIWLFGSALAGLGMIRRREPVAG